MDQMSEIRLEARPQGAPEERRGAASRGLVCSKARGLPSPLTKPRVSCTPPSFRTWHVSQRAFIACSCSSIHLCSCKADQLEKFMGSQKAALEQAASFLRSIIKVAAVEAPYCGENSWCGALAW